MSQKDKNSELLEDIEEQTEEILEKIENEDGSINEEQLKDMAHPSEKKSDQDDTLKDQLARTKADFINYKNRVERDAIATRKYLKGDIIKKLLPRVDDIERILKNTPEDKQAEALFEWVQSLHTKLVSDLKSFWVESFSSMGEISNPDFHDVMTRVPSDKESGTIIDEFEKGYMMDGEVLRHARVIVSM